MDSITFTQKMRKYLGLSRLYTEETQKLDDLDRQKDAAYQQLRAIVIPDEFDGKMPALIESPEDKDKRIAKLNKDRKNDLRQGAHYLNAIHIGGLIIFILSLISVIYIGYLVKKTGTTSIITDRIYLVIFTLVLFFIGCFYTFKRASKVADPINDWYDSKIREINADYKVKLSGYTDALAKYNQDKTNFTNEKGRLIAEKKKRQENYDYWEKATAEFYKIHCNTEKEKFKLLRELPILPEYKGLDDIACLYELFHTKACTTLEGHEGAYKVLLQHRDLMKATGMIVDSLNSNFTRITRLFGIANEQMNKLSNTVNTISQMQITASDIASVLYDYNDSIQRM